MLLEVDNLRVHYGKIVALNGISLRVDAGEIVTLIGANGAGKTTTLKTLSGGEQQMLAIGRALMARPTLLLLDEPSMGLAPLIVQQIFGILREINAQGTTILLVEQNASQALRLSHRAYVLETGKVVRSAPAIDLLHDPSVREAYLGGAAR